MGVGRGGALYLCTRKKHVPPETQLAWDGPWKDSFALIKLGVNINSLINTTAPDVSKGKSKIGTALLRGMGHKQRRRSTREPWKLQPRVHMSPSTLGVRVAF